MDTTNMPVSPSPVLESALEQLRLSGAIFFRSELTEPFAFESTPLALADALHPGAERLILFHIVARGSCWVAIPGGERHWAGEGDVIVLPYGDRHTIGGDGVAEAVPIIALLDPLPWNNLPVLRHGGGGAHTELVCRVPALRGSSLRSGDTRAAIRSRRAVARRCGSQLGAGQHRLLARTLRAFERERESDLDPAPRARPHRGAPRSPRNCARGRSGLVGRAP